MGLRESQTHNIALPLYLLINRQTISILRCLRITWMSLNITILIRTNMSTCLDTVVNRSKREAELNTNRPNPGGHEGKILTKLMNAEKNNQAAAAASGAHREKSSN